MIIKTQRTIFSYIIFISLITLVSCKMFSTHKNNAPRGTHTREILNDTATCPWYASGYSDYTPDAEAVTQLNNGFTAEHEILVFGGTWCGDTKNLLPKFYKVMDAMATSPKIKMVLVDTDRESGEGIEKSYDIAFVPTFIVLKNGKEIGRVIETVTKSIEADLAAILLK